DEPFSGLDPLGVDTMADVLRNETAQGRSVVFSSHQLDLVEDICDEVAVISQGRIVMAGDGRRLKEAAPSCRLEVEVDGPIESVLPTLEGIHSAEVADGRHILMVDAATDVRRVLAEAERTGAVRHFVYTTPTLTDLFREAVR